MRPEFLDRPNYPEFENQDSMSVWESDTLTLVNALMPLGDQLDQMLIAYLKYKNSPSLTSYRRVLMWLELLGRGYNFLFDAKTPGSGISNFLPESTRYDQDAGNLKPVFILGQELFRIHSILWLLEDMVRVSLSESGLNLSSYEHTMMRVSSEIARSNDLRSKIKAALSDPKISRFAVKFDRTRWEDLLSADKKTSTEGRFCLKTIKEGAVKNAVDECYEAVSDIRELWTDNYSSQSSRVW